MPDEIIYQRYIVKSVNQNGGYAVKLSNKVMSGIPDLLLKCKVWTQPQIWEVKRVECSWLSVMGEADPRPIRIGTTPLQDKTLRDMNSAGVHAAILVILPGPGRCVTLALTRAFGQTHISTGEFIKCHYTKTLAVDWHTAIIQLNALNPPEQAVLT